MPCGNSRNFQKRDSTTNLPPSPRSPPVAADCLSGTNAIPTPPSPRFPFSPRKPLHLLSLPPLAATPEPPPPAPPPLGREPRPDDSPAPRNPPRAPPEALPTHGRFAPSRPQSRLPTR